MCRAVDLKSIFIRQNALHFNHFLLIYSPVDLQPIDVWNVDKRLIDLEICRRLHIHLGLALCFGVFAFRNYQSFIVKIMLKLCLKNCVCLESEFVNVKESRNRFQGIDSPIIYSLADRYDKVYCLYESRNCKCKV